jgi:hypothetical protein
MCAHDPGAQRSSGRMSTSSHSLARSSRVLANVDEIGLPSISGDSWPLTERGAVSSPSALIFARDHLVRIDAIDSRFLWKKIRLNERNGHHATFVLADREQIVLCARLLRRHFDHAADPEVDSRRVKIMIPGGSGRDGQILTGFVAWFYATAGVGFYPRVPYVAHRPPPICVARSERRGANRPAPFAPTRIRLAPTETHIAPMPRSTSHRCRSATNL